MALRDTIVDRLIVCIKILRPNETLDLTAKSKLGDPRIGWDRVFLQTDFPVRLKRRGGLHRHPATRSSKE
jgi:hypothetical protein